MVIDEDIRADDISVAERLLGQMYGPTTIESVEQRFPFRQRVRGDERVSLARFEIDSPAQIATEYGRTVGIGSLVSGAYRATTNHDDIDPSAPFALRPGVVQSESAGLVLAMVNLSLDELESVGGYSPTTLHFRGTAPISTAASNSWRRVQVFADAELSNPTTLVNPLLRRPVLDLLIATALATFPIGGRPLHDRLHVAPRSVRRAISFIEDHAAEPIGITEIAAASGLSVRALHAAFRRTLDTTPAVRLRDIRLERVRDELSAAGPGSTSVADVARQWGFAHLGRFAGSYQARYGELPSHTLRN